AWAAAMAWHSPSNDCRTREGSRGSAGSTGSARFWFRSSGFRRSMEPITRTEKREHRTRTQERGNRGTGRTSLELEMIQRIGVVGAGTMGSGIAQVFAQAGYAVRLSDTMPAALERARASIDNSLAKFVEKG